MSEHTHDHNHDHDHEGHEHITLIDDQGNETLYEILRLTVRKNSAATTSCFIQQAYQKKKTLNYKRTLILKTKTVLKVN